MDDVIEDHGNEEPLSVGAPVDGDDYKCQNVTPTIRLVLRKQLKCQKMVSRTWIGSYLHGSHYLQPPMTLLTHFMSPAIV